MHKDNCKLSQNLANNKTISTVPIHRQTTCYEPAKNNAMNNAGLNKSNTYHQTVIALQNEFISSDNKIIY